MDENNFIDKKVPSALTKQSNVKWDTSTRDGREKIEAYIVNWILLLKDGQLKCPNLSCLMKFSHPKSLINHLKSCSSNEQMNQQVLFRGSLPCIICEQEIHINQYVNHFRSFHKAISDNLRRVNNSKTVTCVNSKCSQTFENCFNYMQHCANCKPSYVCDDCKNVYQTPIGLQKHTCSGKTTTIKPAENSKEQHKEDDEISEKSEAGDNGQTEDAALSSDWIEEILSGTLRCPNGSCSKEFEFPKVFLQHLDNCKAKEKVNRTVKKIGILPCVICHNDQLINEYLKHISKSHIEAHENLEKLENGNIAICPNYKCKMKLDSGQMLLKHSMTCRPLYYCDGCNKELTSLRMFSVHKCPQNSDKKAGHGFHQKEKEVAKSPVSTIEINDRACPAKESSVENETSSSDDVINRNEMKREQKRKNKDGTWVRRSIRGSINYQSLGDELKEFISQKNDLKQKKEHLTMDVRCNDAQCTSSDVYNKKASFESSGDDVPVDERNNKTCDQSYQWKQDVEIIEKAADQFKRLQEGVSNKITTPDELEACALSDSKGSKNAMREGGDSDGGVVESVNPCNNWNDQKYNEKNCMKDHPAVNSETTKDNLQGEGGPPDTSVRISDASEPQRKDKIFSNYFAAEKKTLKKRGRPKKDLKPLDGKSDNESNSDSGKKQGSTSIENTELSDIKLEENGERIVKKRGRPKKVSLSKSLQGDELNKKVSDETVSLVASVSDSEIYWKRDSNLQNRKNDAVILTNIGITTNTVTAKDSSSSTAIKYFSDGEQFLKPVKKRGRPKKTIISNETKQENDKLKKSFNAMTLDNSDAVETLPGHDNSEANDAGSEPKKEIGLSKKVSLPPVDDSGVSTPNIVNLNHLVPSTNARFSEIHGSPKRKIGRPKKASVTPDDPSGSLTLSIVKPEEKMVSPSISTNLESSDVEGPSRKKVGRSKKVPVTSQDPSGSLTLSIVNPEEKVASPSISANLESSDVEGPSRKKVGRSKKVPVTSQDPSGSLTLSIVNPEEKVASPSISANLESSDVEGPSKKKVGRPKKVSVTSEDPTGSLTLNAVKPEEEMVPPSISTNLKPSDVEGPSRKKAGRPKKVSVTSEDITGSLTLSIVKPEEEVASPSISANLEPSDVEGPSRKKAGRPKKVSVTSEDITGSLTLSIVKPEEEVASPSISANLEPSDVEGPSKKKVGRPKKVSVTSEDPTGSLTLNAVNPEEEMVPSSVSTNLEPSDVEGPSRKKAGRPKKVSVTSEDITGSLTLSIVKPEEEVASPSISTNLEQPSDVEGPSRTKVGRPKKISVTSEDATGSLTLNYVKPEEEVASPSRNANLESSGVEGSQKRKVGRPRKVSSQREDAFTMSKPSTLKVDNLVLNSDSKLSNLEESQKRKVGRPKKSTLLFGSSSVTSTPKVMRTEDQIALSVEQFSAYFQEARSHLELSDIEGSAKPLKKRGRPRKMPISVDVNKDSALIENSDSDKSFMASQSSQFSDVKVLVKPQRKRGRPKKIGTNNDSNFNDSFSQSHSSFSQSMVSGKRKLAQENRTLDTSHVKNSAFKFLFHGLSPKDSDRPSSSENKRSRSLSDSESTRQCFAISRVRRYSDSECHVKSKKTEKNRLGTHKPSAVDESNVSKEIQLALLKRISHKRGRPSNADLLLRKQAAELLQASGTEADFITPKKKRGRKIKTEDQHEDSPAQVKKAATYLKRRKKSKSGSNNDAEISMLFEANFKDRIESWSNVFNSGLFKCPSETCNEEFVTWITLFHHLPACQANDPIWQIIYHRRTLSCHVCKKQIEVGGHFVKHFAQYHKDVYDLARGLESNGSSICYNYNCNETLTVYNDCVKHGLNCGSLMKCDTCDRKYKTRAYFYLHQKQCLKEMQGRTSQHKIKSSDDSFVACGPRMSAKRAIGAISKLDLSLDDNESIASTSSKKSKLTDEDFDETSVLSADIEADLEDDDDDDDEDLVEDDDEILEDPDGEGKRKKNSNKITRLIKPLQVRRDDQGSPNSMVCKISKKPLKISTIKGLSIRPKKPDIALLRKWKEDNYSESLFSDWMPTENTISKVLESEKACYLPHTQKSPVIQIMYESRSGNYCRTPNCQIPCFKSLPSLKNCRTATFYVGGPVQALEWCPVSKGNVDQYIAVSAHLDYNKVHTALEVEHNKGIIQIWKMAKIEEKRKYEAPSFAFGIVYDFGPVYSMKWCPTACKKVDEENPVKRLGILAVACSDGLVRILSIPFPEDIKALSSAQKGEDDSEGPLIVRIKPSLTLAASRVDAELVCGSCKCMCIEWLPTKGHSKIAAGYADGSICLWNLECESEMLSYISKDKSFKALLPFTRINAHSFTVRCLNWCPSDDNFIISGSFEKLMKVFDIRSPASPVMVFKRAVFENLYCPLQKTGILFTEEESFNCVPAGLRFIDLMSFTGKQIPYQATELITSHNAGCKGFAFSEWLDVAATSCIAGEVMVKSCTGLVKSQRIPVYRVECEPSETLNSNENQENNRLKDSAVLNDKVLSEDEPQDAVDIIKNKAKEFKSAIFKQKYTFKDTNFFEFREQPLHSAEELQRIRSVVKLQSSKIQEHEPRSINKLQWNPNYGNHHMLLSGGTLGIVRIHFFSDWLT